MTIDANIVIAVATSVYGTATLLLVIQIWRDRVQREKHFHAESDIRKLNELQSAFYDAWGYWQGHRNRSFDSAVDAMSSGKVSEALSRFECQLRLNGCKKEANDLGVVIRTSISGVSTPLADAGVALGLVPSEYD